MILPFVFIAFLLWYELREVKQKLDDKERPDIRQFGEAMALKNEQISEERKIGKEEEKKELAKYDIGVFGVSPKFIKSLIEY